MAKLLNLLRRKKSFIIVAVGLILVGFLVYKRFSSEKNRVKTVEIKRGTVVQEIVLPGQILAEEYANLSFLSSGNLNYVSVSEGQFVKKGDILARLDSTNAYQTLLQAEADLRRYEASLEKVYDEIKGHEKDESFEQKEIRTIAETNRDKAYRAYVIAQHNLQNLVLKAPFEGIVSSITHPFNGVNVSLTESQIEIFNPKTIYFSVSADQTEVTGLKVGQKVKVVLDSFPNEEIDGEVSYISFTPKAQEVGTVYEVKVKLLGSVDIQKIRIGMSGDARFIISEKPDVLYLPPEFLKSDRNGKYINLGKKDNKVYIEVGIEGEDRVEIKGEVKEGDVVFD